MNLGPKKNIPVYFCLYSTPLPQAGIDTKTILKQSKAGMNSEISFSKTGCLAKAKEPSLPNSLSLARVGIVRCRTHKFMPFPGAFAGSQTQPYPRFEI